MPGEETIRAFLALEIPEAVKQTVAAQRDRVRPRLPGARWTRPEAWHLTLKFLGDVERGVLNGLSVELRKAVAGVGSVQVRLGGAGFFPMPARPRIAWLGGSSTGSEGVVAAVEGACASWGFERERRRWSLHLTLARLKQRWPEEAVERFIEWGRTIEPGSFACREVVLFKSDLQPGGAVYTALERFPLE